MTPHILLLEDSPLDAELTLAALNNAGIEFSYLRVETEQEFSAALNEREYDLILADYVLLSFDGVSALRLARQRAPQVPFVFVSGTLGEELAIEMLKSGATDYVLKQRLDRLVPAVERALREARERSARQRTETELKQSEEWFRLLIDSVKDYAIFMLAEDGSVASWNVGAERILGFTESEIIGESLAQCFTPEDLAAGEFDKELERARYEGRSEDERWHVRKDGSRFWASGVVTPLYDDSGKLRGFTKVMRDNTDHKLAEIELSRAKEAAEAANRAKDQFLAVLSHELRTPLTPVLATVYALQESQDLGEGTLALIEIIRRNVELEARLIDDLLDLTRISRGKFQLNPETTDVHTLVEYVLEICREEIVEKGLQLYVELAAEKHYVTGDPARLQQVFWNIIKNAIKFTPERGRLIVRTESVEDRFRLSVIDSGIGIDPEVLPRIFNAFEQGEQTMIRRFGGLGLGLTISKALVDMHHGHLTVMSEGQDKGSTFTIDLPITVMQPPAQDGISTATEGHRGIRILIVDDHIDTSIVMKLLLERKGYEVRVAHDVTGALQLARSEYFDLLISDIGLPDGTGHDLMQKLRPEIRMRGIALSGFGMEDDIRQSIAAGFSEHLVKPINFRHLQDAIDRILAEPVSVTSSATSQTASRLA